MSCKLYNYLRLIVVLILCLDKSEPIPITNSDEDNRNCAEIPEPELKIILGSAYNARYMSVEVPMYKIKDNDDSDFGYNNNLSKRKTDSDNFPPFYVDDKYERELSDRPAWEYEDHISLSNRQKRDIKRSTQQLSLSKPWECKSTIKWMDLGSQYYPRYIRSVECEQHRCWYGHFTCQPRSFTIKLLRRRPGKCVNSKPKFKTGVAGMPNDLRELWIWEERAINFCCDCSAPRD